MRYSGRPRFALSSLYQPSQVSLTFCRSTFFVTQSSDEAHAAACGLGALCLIKRRASAARCNCPGAANTIAGTTITRHPISNGKNRRIQNTVPSVCESRNGLQRFSLSESTEFLPMPKIFRICVNLSREEAPSSYAFCHACSCSLTDWL